MVGYNIFNSRREFNDVKGWEIFFEKTAKDGKIVEKREYDVTSITPVKIFEISTNENGGQQFDRLRLCMMKDRFV